MEENPRYVGIDVSKAQVDVAVRPTGQRWAASYNETGVGELVSQMVDIGPAMVLLEATGGLELPLVAALAAAALPVRTVNIPLAWLPHRAPNRIGADQGHTVSVRCLSSPASSVWPHLFGGFGLTHHPWCQRQRTSLRWIRA